jgi:hypothetical protein
MLPLVFAVPVQGSTGLTQGPSQTQGTSVQRNLGVMAQTFTAPADTRLDHVSLQVYTASYSPFTVEIRRVASDGTPDLTGDPLAKASSPGWLSWGWDLYYDFSFGAAGVALTKGVQYAIVVNVPFGVVGWYDISVAPDPAAFSGGQSWVSGCLGCGWLSGGQFGADFNFKTWLGGATAQQVTVPTVKIDSILPADALLIKPLIIAPQESLNFVGSFTDQGNQDTHTFLWDFGDHAKATTLTASHAYATSGTYAVTLTVSNSGAAGQATAKVTVQTPQQSLGAIIAYVQSLTTLTDGQKNSLIAKLNAASDSVARGDSKAAHNQLSAFLNELQADYNAGKVSLQAFNALRADVHLVEGSLGTFNRFLEWWPFAA